MVSASSQQPSHRVAIHKEIFSICLQHLLNALAAQGARRTQRLPKRATPQNNYRRCASPDDGSTLSFCQASGGEDLKRHHGQGQTPEKEGKPTYQCIAKACASKIPCHDCSCESAALSGTAALSSNILFAQYGRFRLWLRMYSVQIHAANFHSSALKQSSANQLGSVQHCLVRPKEPGSHRQNACMILHDICAQIRPLPYNTETSTLWQAW